MQTKRKESVKALASKQLSFLRGLGHHLSPKVMIGKEGVSASILSSAEEVLVADELIKIKIMGSSEVDRQQAAVFIAEKTKSSVVQVLGKTILLYRRNKEKKADKQIHLP